MESELPSENRNRTIRNLWKGGILCLLVASAYMAGRWHIRRAEAVATPAAGGGSRAGQILYYHCPMHPQYRSDRPGDAPCCGMRLEPVYADGAEPEARSLPPGVFHVSPQKQQLVGIEFAPAEVIRSELVIRAAGKVAYDQQETVIIADVYEYESTALRLGQKAWVSRPYPPRKAFWATVDYFYPRLDPNSRTLKVRLNAGDVGVKFIPDTFMDVELRVPSGPVLTVPTDAVLNSGLRKLVYLDRGQGLIEAREVETGRRFRDRIEILLGLKSGERVAVSGVFLLDSESRMKLPTAAQPRRGSIAAGPMVFPRHPSQPPNPEKAGTRQGIDQLSSAPFRDESGMVTASNPLQTSQTTQTDPICGMFVDTLTAGLRKSDYKGKTYYFCSTECKRKFDANPAAHAMPANPAAEPGAAAAPAATQATPAPDQPWAAPDTGSTGPAKQPIDPVCGKPVDEKSAWVRVGYGRRLVREYEGRLLYFCSVECKREFDNNPAVYGMKALEREAGKPQQPHD